MLTPKGASRCVLPCGVEVIRKVGELDPDRPETMIHTVIVAGQHGGETGPVLALLARGAADLDLHRVEYGVLTIVRCANPHGFAMGQRDDAFGRDMNRGWTSEALLDHAGEPTRVGATAQAQLWRAIVADFIDLELLVLDLHSSGMAGPLARKVVVVDGTGSAPAIDLVVTLALADAQLGVAAPDLDRPWDILEQWTSVDPSDRERHHPAGTLASWANSVGGIGFTVEFAEYTQRQLPAGYDGPVGRNPAAGYRTMTLGERTHGVWTLLCWAIARHGG